MKTAVLFAAYYVGTTLGDVYLHSPRGSNNRNCRNDNNENRRNGNRLFDSQNNNKGGYSCPRSYPFDCYKYDQGSEQKNTCQQRNTQNPNAGLVNSDKNSPDFGELVSNNAVKNERMFYYVDSILPLEWTAQHGCGDNPKVHCDMIIEVACEDTLSDALGTVRDGTPVNNNDNNNLNDEATTTIPDNNNNQEQSDGRYGRHETLEYYNTCRSRSRNKNLWIADQNVVNNKGASATRQNPNANRNGLECKEECDYYPYWHPSPWKTVAILTSNTSRCDFLTSESQNVKSKNECVCPEGVLDDKNGQLPNNEEDCKKEAAKGCTWNTVKAWGIPAPECLEGAFSRDNHLGNAATAGSDPIMYNWTLPDWLLEGEGEFDSGSSRCVLRLRYNLSSSDAGNTPVFGDKSLNAIKTNQKNGKVNPAGEAIKATYVVEEGDTLTKVANKFNVPYGEDIIRELNKAELDQINGFNVRSTIPAGTVLNIPGGTPIYDRDNNEYKSYKRFSGFGFDASVYADSKAEYSGEIGFATNTNQFGRVFQDRSYTFSVVNRDGVVGGKTWKPRGATAHNDANEAEVPGKCAGKLYNLNVRGKRGNIVQAYPSVEYDFVPNKLEITEDDCLHLQWTGTDYNPNRNPNNGEGGPPNPNNPNEGKSDRTNMVQTNTQQTNAFPILDASEFNMFDASDTQWKRMTFLDQPLTDPEECMTAEEIKNEGVNNREDRERDYRNCGKLSGQKIPHINIGVVKAGSVGTYEYMSTRNNNLSNRGQKGVIKITEGEAQNLSAGAVAGIVIGSLIVIGAAGAGGMMLYQRHGSSAGSYLPHRNNGGGAVPRETKALASGPSGSVTAKHDYKAAEAGELSFKKGDRITVLRKDGSGWWEGRCNGQTGVFPSNYVA